MNLNSRAGILALLVIAATIIAVVLFRHDGARLSVATEESHSDDSIHDAVGATDGSLARSNKPSETSMMEAYGAGSFSKLKECYFTASQMAALKATILECESLAGLREVENSYIQCRKNIDERRNSLGDMKQKLADCPNESAIAAAYYMSTRAAAAAGNQDAQLCYLQSAFGTELIYSEQDIRRYEQDAPRYADAAMQRGDWRIVELMSMGRFTEASGLLPRLTSGVLSTRYTMNRLARLGATDGYANYLDMYAKQDILSASRTGSDALSPKEISEAENEARRLYALYFTSSPRQAERPIACKAS